MQKAIKSASATATLCDEWQTAYQEETYQDKFDDLDGHKEGDGDQVREQDPEGDEQDDDIYKAVLVVAVGILVKLEVIVVIAPCLAPGVGANGK